MLGKLEKEKLNEIFSALDSDHDGKITASNIDITGNIIKETFLVLPIKLLEILSPLFKNLEDNSLTMTAEEFVLAAYQNYKGLTVLDKQAVLDFNKRFKTKEELKNPTFTVLVFLYSLYSLHLTHIQ